MAIRRFFNVFPYGHMLRFDPIFTNKIIVSHTHAWATGWPFKHGRVVLVPCKKKIVHKRYTAYNEQITLYKVPEIHGHVYPVAL